MNAFTPTHLITVTDENGHVEKISVMLIDGAAYTRREFEASAYADWECSEDGEWTFQGRAHPSVGTVHVERCA